ncbi:MAG: NADH-quinone oxidoreductase subunit C [Methanomassiliicoccales archaeon]
MEFLGPNEGISEEAITDRLKERFTSGMEVESISKRRINVNLDKDILLDFCRYLRDELDFEHNSCVTGVDYRDRFQMVYHVTSYANSCMMEIRVDLDHDEPEVESVAPVWRGADWHERETYDMMGIIFKNHPDLRRIFLPYDTKFFPQRKDFELRGRP